MIHPCPETLEKTDREVDTRRQCRALPALPSPSEREARTGANFQQCGALPALLSPSEREARTGANFQWSPRRLFHPGYSANLVDHWIPALEDAREKLQAGAKVADIGCGHGASTIIMAKAFPKSTFIGFDAHRPSIDKARELAAGAGLNGRVTFEVANATSYPGYGYDLVALFDCLHDMVDPVGAARWVRRSLDPDGTLMLVEPFATNQLENNLTPVGRVYYSASTMVCTPCSLSQEVGLGLGAQAGPERLQAVIEQAGFTRFRKATDTPLNLVLEARP